MMEDAADNLEARAVHAFRILDNPRADKVNVHKFSAFLEEIGMDLEPETIERITELISSSDEAEFTEDDLLDYIRANIKLGQAMENSRMSEETA